MRNLFHLIRRIHVFLLFLALQVFSLVLVFQNHIYHKTAFINASNGLSGWVYDTRSDISQYLQLRRINDELSLQNSMLRSELSSSYINIDSTSRMVNDTVLKQRFRYIPAVVINNSLNRQTNYITLDKGRSSGIEKGMGVIAGNSVVGKVVNVSEHFSVAMSVLHRSFVMSVETKSTGDDALLEWDNADPDYATIKDLPRHVNIHLGDTIVTSGNSDYFPRNLLAGYVSTIETPQNENKYRITVRLSTDFRKLNHVSVIENLMKPEQMMLEMQAQEQHGSDDSQ